MDKTFPVDKICRLPHFRKREEPIKYIIIHCSRGNTAEQLDILNKNGLSVHYIIDAKGKITEVIPPEDVAYHAGISHWKDSLGESLNGSSIGIEIQSTYMGQKKRSYTGVAITSLCRLLKFLTHKYKIRSENILGHSDVAPTRKPDPGARFPWLQLYNNGVTFRWHDRILSPITDEVELFKIIGYDVSNLAATRYAFCRHFLPDEVFVEEDIQKLLDNPYPKDFKPKDWDFYMRRLRAVARAYESERKRSYWYL